MWLAIGLAQGHRENACESPNSQFGKSHPGTSKWIGDNRADSEESDGITWSQNEMSEY
jgi:hypothetical protein